MLSISSKTGVVIFFCFIAIVYLSLGVVNATEEWQDYRTLKHECDKGTEKPSLEDLPMPPGAKPESIAQPTFDSCQAISRYGTGDYLLAVFLSPVKTASELLVDLTVEGYSNQPVSIEPLNVN